MQPLKTNTKCVVYTWTKWKLKNIIEYDRNTGEVHGFVNIGSGSLNDDTQPQATKALMIIAVAILGNWKIPLGYYLTDGTNSEFQATILSTIIEKLWDGGTLVVSITFDGLAANVKTLERLGGSLKSGDIISLFPHPASTRIQSCNYF